MKTPIFLLSILVLLVPGAFASLPDVVIQQIRRDIRDAMTQNGQMPPSGVVDETLGKVRQELESGPRPFDLSPAQLVEFRNEAPSVTDAEVDRVMAELKRALRGRPLPYLLAHYERLRIDRRLTPRQKMLCHLLTLRLSETDGLPIPSAPKS
ncbi:MAG: hypothetical protein JNN17_05170 [Verrucomicrobiaceae bacterium]|nr:hypothetical protein [Verrucomicrobiaceae bacterium]